MFSAAKSFKEKPENLTRELDTDAVISWGRSRTDISAISENKLNSLSATTVQSKKDQSKTKQLLTSSDEDSHYCLPYFNGQMFATVLEDAIIDLNILDECSIQLLLSKILTDFHSLTRLKYNVVEPPVPWDEISDIDKDKLDCFYYKIHKIYNDRNTITELLYKLYVELCTMRCFNALEDRVSDILDKNESYRLLQETEAKNKILCKELRKQLRNLRNRIKTLMYDSDVSIDKLLRKIEDENLLTEIQDRYVVNWEKARTEQHVLTIEKKDGKFVESSKYYKIRADGEQRVHEEIAILTNVIISDTLTKIENSMAKYDTDMEEMDLKIQIGRNKHAAMKEKRIDLEQTIALHDKQLWDWNRFKEERERIKLYHDTMQKSAIIAQAWWRGIIVRKQLGPFRVKKRASPKRSHKVTL